LLDIALSIYLKSGRQTKQPNRTETKISQTFIVSPPKHNTPHRGQVYGCSF
jgi:hypothetical protein